MSTTRYTTESGATYDVNDDTGLWRKRQGPWESIWGIKAGQRGKVTGWPWDAPEDWEDRRPEVGEHLFITSRDTWWASTPVASIEVIP